MSFVIQRVIKGCKDVSDHDCVNRRKSAKIFYSEISGNVPYIHEGYDTQDATDSFSIHLFAGGMCGWLMFYEHVLHVTIPVTHWHLLHNGVACVAVTSPILFGLAFRQ